MALRRVTTPNTYKAINPNTILNDAIVEGSRTPGLIGSSNTAGSWGAINATQAAAGFQSANTIGQKYPSLHEAPVNYLASSFTQAQSDADRYGMMASLFGGQVRQALETPITHRGDVMSATTAGPGGSITSRVSIDWALGEKQATVGTPQYFQKLYRDSMPITGDPYSGMMAIPGLSASTRAAVQQAGYQARAYETATQTSGGYAPPSYMSYRSPHEAAELAYQGGYSSYVARPPDPTPSYEEYLYPSYDIRRNESYLGTGTGDFRTSRTYVSGGYSLPYPTTPARLSGTSIWGSRY
jgi:hypothetical protein